MIEKRCELLGAWLVTKGDATEGGRASHKADILNHTDFMGLLENEQIIHNRYIHTNISCPA